jgi:isopentenyl phosphate kinase
VAFSVVFTKAFQLHRVTVVKLGGSVITHKSASPPRLNHQAVKRIAQELKASKDQLVIVLGGGAHGHQAAHQFGFGDPTTPKERLLAGIPVIRHYMTVLSLQIEHMIQSAGIPAVVFPPFSFVLLHDGSISDFPAEFIRMSIRSGLAIITHGDVCFDDVRGASILSGDTILVHLAKVLDAESVYIGTDVDGVYEADPKDNPDARIIPTIDKSNIDRVLLGAGSSKATDVTGGMAAKLADLAKLAGMKREIAVFNLSIPGRLEAMLSRKPVVCTRIVL